MKLRSLLMASSGLKSCHFVGLLTFAAVALASPSLYAAPTGGEVTAGVGTIGQSGATTSINQTSQNLAINWQSFNVARNETVNFNQPNSTATALNRVLGQSPSEILGSVNANGRLFILNPNGVLFGADSQVNVGGLVASTMDLSDTDFMKGNYHLTGGEGRGSIVNKGRITAKDGGAVALLASQVSNEGIISARLGTVAIGAGNEVTISFDGNGSLVSFSVDKGTLEGLAANKGLIVADGGRVYMTAKAADAISKAVVNNTGIVEARTVSNQNGAIVLGGDGTTSAEVSGTLDASAQEGTGGKVVVTAKQVSLHDGAVIDASGAQGGGSVYVGGGWQGKDASIANADVVVMQAGAKIDVSAKKQGNGGTAVLWSKNYTGFAGSIDASTNAQGGQGGSVETSSHGTLNAIGFVKTASASCEASGIWLLDPYNVVIASAGATGDAYAASYTPTQDSTILASSIVTSLDAGTNVLITTGSGAGASAGNITVNADILKTGLNASTLTLAAANDILINAAISSAPTLTSGNYYGRLNVVLKADADNSGAGNISFASTGSVTTYNGNFIAGSGDVDSVTTYGHDLTMAAGSFIDVGYGNLIIKVAGDVSLAANSLRALNSTYSPQSYYNNNNGRYYQTNFVSVTGGTITSSNTNASTPDIVTNAETRLTAGTIGSAINPIKVSGTADLLGQISNPNNSTITFPSVGRPLYITNSSGSSYVNEIGSQVFSSISVNIGSQASATQLVNIMGDQGGTGHIRMNTNASGVLVLATGDISTAGVAGTYISNDWVYSTDPSVFPTSVSIAAGSITYANNAVNTGSYVNYYYAGTGIFRHDYGMTSYSASFSATSNNQTSAAVDGVADIKTVSASFNGSTLGTLANPLEIGSGSYLYVTNTGGSTFIDSVDNAFSVLSLTNYAVAGTHAIHYADGEHIDYITDASGIYVPTIATTGCATTTSCGMNVAAASRNISLTANTGSIVFADNAVNTNGGYFTASLASINNTGSILAENDYNAAAQAAQITAGNVSFNSYSSSSTGTIGGGTKNIQVAYGGSATDNTLAVNTYSGDVNIHELSTNHFKTLNLTLNGANVAQNVAIDLAGSDDVNFSDSGSLVTIDATKVNLSANNRNWNLTANSRNIEIDGVALGTGTYTVYAGNVLRLNSDVVTNDGAINLTGGSGIYLMKSVSVDSNSDNTGNSGSIYMMGMLSGTAAGYTLTVDSHSTSAAGGSIQMYSGANNGGGSYLSGLTLVSSGVAVNGSNDGVIYLYNNNYSLNGSFASTGNTYLQTSLTIDTEQGNVADAGNITFSGYNLTAYYWGWPTFNTSTTAAGKNGGAVDLYGTIQHNALNTTSISVNTTGGAGGTSGAITLPSVVTTRNGYSNTQSYTGGIITLHGDLTSDKGAIALAGDARLATNVTIDTWAATNSQQTGTAGAVTMSGAGVSALASGLTLTINTNTDTGAGYYNPPTNTQSFTHNGGAVSVVAGNAGGYYLDQLTVNTMHGGTYNNGTDGTITLATVGTTGNQTYSGGALTLNNGAVTTNGGAIDLRGVAAITVAGTASLDTDRTGGTSAAGAINFGSVALNGAGNLTIDVTADGGGASQDLTLYSIGNVTPLASLTAKAQNLTVSGAGLHATGAITLEAQGVSSDLTLNASAPVVTSSGLVTLYAGRNFINNNAADTGIQTGSGRYLVYATNPATSTEGMTGYNKHYNQTYTAGSVPSYASAGNWFFYTVAPTLTITPDPLTIPYNGDLSGVTYTIGGTYLDGDTNAHVSGEPIFTATIAPGQQNITYTGGLLSALGYQFVDDGGVGELTVTPAPVASPTAGAGAVASLPNGTALVPQYTAAVTAVTTGVTVPTVTNVADPILPAPVVAQQPEPLQPQTQVASAEAPGAAAGGHAPHFGVTVDLQVGTVTVQNGGVRLPEGGEGAPIPFGNPGMGSERE